MTLNEIRSSEKAMLTPADIAEVIGADPQSIRTMAKKRPDLLGFPVCVVGSRTKISREGFLRWYDGKEDVCGNAS